MTSNRYFNCNRVCCVGELLSGVVWLINVVFMFILIHPRFYPSVLNTFKPLAHVYLITKYYLSFSVFHNLSIENIVNLGSWLFHTSVAWVTVWNMMLHFALLGWCLRFL